MQDLDDSALLRRYAQEQSEEAFATLVRRHVNLVYSVALRQAGNPHEAEEITQAVFIILAKKAAHLYAVKALAGWLFQVTRLTAKNFVRSEMRRHRREQEAQMQSSLNGPETDVWRRIAPLLDAAVGELREKDRQAIVLRFYEGRNLREVGRVLGASEDAAEKRVSRAVEKLRKFFAKRGVVSTATILAGAMAANSVQAAPAGLAGTATAAAVAKGVAAGGATLTLAKGVLKIMAWTKMQTALVGVAILALAAFSVAEHQERVKLRGANEGLQQQLAQAQMENDRLAAKQAAAPVLQLPAPQMQASQLASPADAVETNTLYERLKDKHVKLTREQVEAFLKANGRTAATLLAAFRTSGDRALLAEAAEKFPNDPHVAFETAMDKSLSPADQRLWLDAFERSAPDNALANYLSALNYFNAGQTDKAVQELSAASGKRINDYTVDRAQGDDEAFLAAGYPLADARTMSSRDLMLPQLAQVKQLSIDTIDLANAYQQSGDTASAQAALQTAAGIGQQFASPAPGESAISQLVGIWIEKAALNAMDPTAPFGNDGSTVQDELNRLTQQKAAFSSLEDQVEPLLPKVSDQDLVIYKDRWLMFGEQNAGQWIVNKYGKQ